MITLTCAQTQMEYSYHLDGTEFLVSKILSPYEGHNKLGL